MIWVQILWIFFRSSWHFEETFDIEIDNDEAEKIVTVGDAVEQIKNAIND